MSDTTSFSTPGTRTVTAFFDTKDHAEKAKADLVAAGLDADGITIVGSETDQFTVVPDHHQGFWEALGNFFMPDDDRRAYSEGLRRGGFAISVRTGEALYKQAVDVLDRDGAVDLDERSMAWESEGWSRSQGGVDNVEVPAYKPADASTAGFGGSMAGQDGIATEDEATNPDVRERIGAGTASQTTPAPTGGPHTYAAPATPASDSLADALEGRPPAASGVGRRDTDLDRPRVRSYIVEGDVNR